MFNGTTVRMIPTVVKHAVMIIGKDGATYSILATIASVAILVKCVILVLLLQPSKDDRRPVRPHKIAGQRHAQHPGWADDNLRGRPPRPGSAQAASASSARRVLRWHGLNRLDRVDRPTGRALRCYERSAPGELAHLRIDDRTSRADVSGEGRVAVPVRVDWPEPPRGC